MSYATNFEAEILHFRVKFDGFSHFTSASSAFTSAMIMHIHQALSKFSGSAEVKIEFELEFLQKDETKKAKEHTEIWGESCELQWHYPY